MKESTVQVPRSVDGLMVEGEGKSLRPLSCLKDLQSPDLESSLGDDPLSYFPSQQDYNDSASPCYP